MESVLTKELATSRSNPVLSEKVHSWIIIGETAEGKTFRPSTWAERLCELLIVFHDNGSFHYHHDLRPVNFNGHHAIRVDHALKSDKPLVWEQVMSFARMYDLQMVEYVSPWHEFLRNVLPDTKQHWDEITNADALEEF